MFIWNKNTVEIVIATRSYIIDSRWKTHADRWVPLFPAEQLPLKSHRYISWLNIDRWTVGACIAGQSYEIRFNIHNGRAGNRTCHLDDKDSWTIPSQLWGWSWRSWPILPTIFVELYWRSWVKSWDYDTEFMEEITDLTPKIACETIVWTTGKGAKSSISILIDFGVWRVATFQYRSDHIELITALLCKAGREISVITCRNRWVELYIGTRSWPHTDEEDKNARISD